MHTEKHKSESVLAVKESFDKARPGVRSLWDQKDPVQIEELGLSSDEAEKLKDFDEGAFETLWSEIAQHPELSKMFL